MGAAQKFKQTQLVRQTGEVARLKVVQGPDLGSTFVLTGGRATIGRGDENDIILSDLRASRKHCELIWMGGAWSVQDAGSVNGIALNGKASRGGLIKSRDTLGLGETVLEFVSADSGTLVLVSSPSTVEQVISDQANYEAQRAKIQAMSRFGGLAKNTPRSATPEATIEARRPETAPQAKASTHGLDPKKALMIGAALIGGYLFFLDPAPAPKPKADDKKEIAEVAGALSLPDDAAVVKTADMFFRTGFREYRLRNYLRAKTQFENVLQMSPGHRLAKIYLKNSELRIEEEVKDHLDIGRKSLDAGKLNDAKGHYETVMRLLFRDPQNPAFIEAHDQLEKVRKELSRGND